MIRDNHKGDSTHNHDQSTKRLNFKPTNSVSSNVEGSNFIYSETLKKSSLSGMEKDWIDL